MLLPTWTLNSGWHSHKSARVSRWFWAVRCHVLMEHYHKHYFCLQPPIMKTINISFNACWQYWGVPLSFHLVNFKELTLSFADNQLHSQNKLHPRHHHHFHLDRVGARCAYRPDQDLFLCRAWCYWAGLDLVHPNYTQLRKCKRAHLFFGRTSLRRLRRSWRWWSWWGCSGLAVRPGIGHRHVL